MLKLKLFALVMLFGVAALGLTPAPAKAVVIYSYAGNNFNAIFDNTPPAGNYTMSMSVSGSFTVAAPLLSLSAATNIGASVLSYSFSDGRQTLDDTNSSIQSLALTTGPTGDVIHNGLINWSIFISQTVPPPVAIGTFINVIKTESGLFSDFDIGRSTVCTLLASPGNCGGPTDAGESHGQPGVWSFRPVTVPEPSTLLLFGVGLAGLAGFGRRRRQD